MLIPLEKIKFRGENRQLGDCRELAATMDKLGQQSPIVVFSSENHYVVIHGHRRIEAAKLLGWKQITAHVVKMPGDLTLARLADNLARKQPNLPELLDLCENYLQSIPTWELANSLGISNSYARNLDRMVKNLTRGQRQALRELGDDATLQHAYCMLKNIDAKPLKEARPRGKKEIKEAMEKLEESHPWKPALRWVLRELENLPDPVVE